MKTLKTNTITILTSLSLLSQSTLIPSVSFAQDKTPAKKDAKNCNVLHELKSGLKLTTVLSETAEKLKLLTPEQKRGYTSLAILAASLTLDGIEKATHAEARILKFGPMIRKYSLRAKFLNRLSWTLKGASGVLAAEVGLRTLTSATYSDAVLFRKTVSESPALLAYIDPEKACSFLQDDPGLRSEVNDLITKIGVENTELSMMIARNDAMKAYDRINGDAIVREQKIKSLTNEGQKAFESEKQPLSVASDATSVEKPTSGLIENQ